MAKKREYKKWSQQQYTHAAVWTVIAEAILNLNDKAFEHFKMINPIEHAKTKELATKYQVEPYVVAADVYGAGNLAGRGGWTWYTGSSSWMYIAGIKYLLGIHVQGNILTIDPHVPADWNGYSIKFHYGKSLYNITVKRSETEEKYILINGKKIEEKEIKLNINGEICNIEYLF